VLAVGGVSRRPFRAASVERALRGRSFGDELLREAVRDVAAGQEFLDDGRASSEYRAHLADVFARRALRKAAERCGVSSPG